MPTALTGDEEEALELLFSLLPPGADDLYDFGTSTADVRYFFEALARAVNTYGIQVIESLRTELMPSTCSEKLPDWEYALGINVNTLADSTDADRQAAVVAKLREWGSYTHPNLQAALAPLLGYADPDTLVIVETDRSALKASHTYSNANGGTVSATGPISQTVTVIDDGSVSRGGVQVSIGITSRNPARLSATLTGPANTFSASGTASATAGSPTITGSGTNFTGLSAGCYFKVPTGDNGRVYRVASVESATSMTIAADAAATASASAWVGSAWAGGPLEQATATWEAGTIASGSVSSSTFVLTALLDEHKAINGAWTLDLGTTAASATLISWSLFVEGGGLDSA